MSRQELHGRVALVTGASRGIGRAIAERLAAAGATVVLSARSVSTSRDGLRGTVDEGVAIILDRGGEAVAMALDVEDPVSRQALIDGVIGRLGRIDILVNNAGRGHLERVLDMTLDTSISQTQQYLLGPLHMSLLTIPHMRRQGAGWIVNLGSSSVVHKDEPGTVGLALYGSLKAAVHRLSAGLAYELREHNIAVNVVSPVSFIVTPGTESLGLNSPEMRPFAEAVEHLAEATLALVSTPPREQTGVVAFSSRYLDEIGRSTMSLDGKTIVQARGHP